MKTSVENFRTLVESIRTSKVCVYVEADGKTKIISSCRCKSNFRMTCTDSNDFSLIDMVNLERAFDTAKDKFYVWFSDPMDNNMQYIENLSNEVCKLLGHLDANGRIGQTPSVREANEKAISRYNQEIDEQTNLILAALNGRSFYQYEQDQLAALITKK